jgi:peptidoglycan/xylan/chitin deacetylase (PgdA/CDA1 family)
VTNYFIFKDNFPASRYPFADKMPMSEIPQFITLTFDDGVSPTRINSVREYVMTLRDSRNCPPAFTFFVSFDYTMCELVKGVYKGGNELGTHTLQHTGQPSIDQINDAIVYMNETCGIPKEEIKGFRTPYLDYDQATLEHLYDLDVLYDTTIVLSDNDGDDIGSDYGRENYWPFTLDDPDDVEFSCICDKTIPLPGMWEIPMYKYFDNNDEVLWGKFFCCRPFVDP